MSKPSKSTAHPYEPEERPILDACSEWALFEGSGKMDPEAELSKIMDALAKMYGGGWFSRPGDDVEQGQDR